MLKLGCFTVCGHSEYTEASIEWPAPGAALTPEVVQSTERLLDWLEDEATTDILLLRERGLTNPGALPLACPLDVYRRWETQLVRIDRLPIVSMAIIDGLCTRSWMQLALACDHRIATRRSHFEVPEVKEGCLPGMNVFRLAKYVGIGVARRLVFTGEALSADQAASVGLLERVCEASSVIAEANAFVKALQPVHATAIRLARRLLNESFSTSFEDFIGHYLASQHLCLESRAAASRESA